MSFLWFLLIGLAAGAIANNLIKGNGVGLIGNLITGICGALLGGWLADELKITRDNDLLTKLLVATAGSIILLLLIMMIKKKR